MRIADMRRREDFDEPFRRTLEHAWSTLGARVGSPREMGPKAQPWFEHPLFSAYFVRDPAPVVRKHLSDSFCYTHAWRRAFPQFALGSTLATSRGLRLSSRPGFCVVPDVPGAEHLLIAPGNRRVRIFDFDARTTRVIAKNGFDRETIRREIAVRGDGRNGPFINISRSDPDGAWFEEALLDGWPLPRCPPWVSWREAERRAFATLDAWLRADVLPVDAAEHAHGLSTRIRSDCESLGERFSGACFTELLRRLDALAAVARRLEVVELARTHGDFQPGNIFVECDGRVVLIDWEFSGRRMIDYDRLVYGLASRSGRGLSRRLRQFVDSTSPAFPLDAFAARRSTREPLVAMFLLEDFAWFSHQARCSAFRSICPSFVQYIGEFESFEARPGDFFGACA